MVRKARTKSQTTDRKSQISEPEWAEGSTRLGAILSDEFKIGISKQLLGSFKKWNPPFPAAKNNRFHLESCRAWIREYYLPEQGPVTDADKALFKRALQAKAQQEIDEQEKGAIQLGVLKKEYIKRGIAEITLAGVVVTLKAFLRAELDRNLPAKRAKELTGLGVEKVLVNKFTDFDRKLAIGLLKAIEDKCRELADAGRLVEKA